MVVKIRLARLGCRNHPFYRVVVTDSKTTRDGKQLEVLGFYNPVAGKDDDKRMSLKLERIKYWLSVGAKPSEPVEHLLFRAGLGQSHQFPVAALNGHILNQDQPTIAADHNGELDSPFSFCAILPFLSLISFNLYSRYISRSYIFYCPTSLKIIATIHLEKVGGVVINFLHPVQYHLETN